MMTSMRGWRTFVLVVTELMTLAVRVAPVPPCRCPALDAQADRLFAYPPLLALSRRGGPRRHHHQNHDQPPRPHTSQSTHYAASSHHVRSTTAMSNYSTNSRRSNAAIQQLTTNPSNLSPPEEGQQQAGSSSRSVSRAGSRQSTISSVAGEGSMKGKGGKERMTLMDRFTGGN
jgi:hypothetical protein